MLLARSHDWLRSTVGRVQAAIDDLDGLPLPQPREQKPAALTRRLHPIAAHWLPPIDSQDVWAAGVTYERSRAARQEEA